MPVSDKQKKKFPAGSFRQIRLTRESDELIKALEEAAMRIGEASSAPTQPGVGEAYSILNTARERLARRLADLEGIAGQTGTVVRRYQ